MAHKHPPCRVLYPIQRAAREIHAALGAGLKCGVYLDALEQRFAGGLCGMERGVLLPVVAEGIAREIRADFTFKNRTVLVRVVSNMGLITEEMRVAHWFAMNDTGVPLGIILNFGRDEFDYQHVVHKGYEYKLKAERGLLGVPKETALESRSA
jgi:GxxExxY protein